MFRILRLGETNEVYEVKPILRMNLNDNIPYQPRQDQTEEAWKLWQESEWHLNFLRSEGEERPKPLTDEELIKWMQRQS